MRRAWAWASRPRRARRGRPAPPHRLRLSARLLPPSIPEQEGILDREKLGLGFEVYCTVKLSLPTKENLDTFEQAVGKWAEVVQCATVTGAADYEMRIVTRDMRAFDEFLRDKLLSLGLVSNIESRIVIRGVKNSTAVPLGLVSPYVSPLG